MPHVLNSLHLRNVSNDTWKRDHTATTHHVRLLSLAMANSISSLEAGKDNLEPIRSATSKPNTGSNAAWQTLQWTSGSVVLWALVAILFLVCGIPLCAAQSLRLQV